MPKWDVIVPPRILTLMWAEKMDALWDEYPCQCCCWEHTWLNCPARHYNGCRSGLPIGYIATEDGEDSYRYDC